MNISLTKVDGNYQVPINPDLINDLSGTSFDNKNLIVRVNATYADKESFQKDFVIELKTAEINATYNLNINANFTSCPDEYAYVYVINYATDETILHGSQFLDYIGHFDYTFSNISDTTGNSQYTLIYLYDKDWNFIECYRQDLIGDLTGSITYNVNDGGIYTLVSTTYFDLTIDTRCTNAPSGFAYIYLFDSYTGSVLNYYSSYLDSYGHFNFTLSSNTDQTGQNHIIGIYLYDKDGNNLGYHSYEMIGDFSGSVIYQYDGIGNFTKMK